jgi:hypothetical protein
MVPSRFLNLSGTAIGGGSGIYYNGLVIPDTPATTTIADVTAVGTVSSLSTGVFDTLVEGNIYMYKSYWNNVGASGGPSEYWNGDTTTTNYFGGQVRNNASNASSDDNALNSLTSLSTGFANAQGLIGVHNGFPFLLGRQTSFINGLRGRGYGWYNTSESTFTQLQYDKSSSIGNGSFIKVWQLNSTPIIDVSVSGASVTSMSSGAINLEEGKTYMTIIGITAESSSSYANLYINSDTTAANYQRGTISSDASLTDTTGAPTLGTVPADGFCVMYGYINLVDGVPCMKLMDVKNSATSRYNINSVYSLTETTITSLDVTANTSNWLKAGSFFKLYEMGGA